MATDSNKVSKVFMEDKDQVYQKCLSAISNCGYSVEKTDVEYGVITCIVYNLSKQPAFRLKCAILSDGNSTKCSISTDEVLQGLPILDKWFHMSKPYSQKILEKM